MGTLEKENAASTGVERDVLEDTNKSAYPHYRTNLPTKTSILTSKLLEHWISCRGHRFGYDLEVIE